MSVQFCFLITNPKNVPIIEEKLKEITIAYSYLKTSLSEKQKVNKTQC